MNKKIILSLLLAVLVLVSVSAVAAADINVKGTSFDDVQKVIDNANPGDVIYLNNCTYKVNETTHKPIIVNTSDLTIYGGKNANDNKHSTLDGLGISQIMSINATNIKIIGVNFVNGYANNGGAIVLNPGSSLTIIDSSFYNNGYASDYDKPIEKIEEATDILKSSPANEFLASDEPNTDYGGAIFALNSDLNVVNSVFTNNGAFHGGAIYGNNVNLNIVECTFKSNKDIDLQSYGGAIYAIGSLTLTDSKFISNYAYLGGAIYYMPSSLRFEGSLTVDGCTFTGNSANYGGAIYAPYGDITITDSEFIQNRGNGAAIYNSLEYMLNNGDYPSSFINKVLNSKNSLNIDNSIFTNNLNRPVARQQQADVKKEEAAVKDGTEAKSADIVSFKETNDGALYGMYGAVVTSFSLNVDESKFTGNIANGFAGAITITDLFNGKPSDPISSLFTSVPVINAVISNSEFNSNLGATGGAIAFVSRVSQDPIASDKLTIYNSKFDTNSIVSGNSYPLAGGAILSMATTVVDESTFINNYINSTENGGAIPTPAYKGSNAYGPSIYYDGTGGALAVMGNLNITDSYFEDNKALRGGAVAVVGILFIDDCSFVNNNGSFVTVISLLDEAENAYTDAQNAFAEASKFAPGDSRIPEANKFLNNAQAALKYAKENPLDNEAACRDCIQNSNNCIDLCENIIQGGQSQPILVDLYPFANNLFNQASSLYEEALAKVGSNEDITNAKAHLDEADKAIKEADKYAPGSSERNNYCKSCSENAQECINLCQKYITQEVVVPTDVVTTTVKYTADDLVDQITKRETEVNKNVLLDTSNAGGAIFVLGLANINNCLFTDNYAYSSGAINIVGSINITDCDFVNNTAVIKGGAVSSLPLGLFGGSSYNVNTEINIVGCSFIGNSVIDTDELRARGGAIYADSSLNVLDSYFEANTAYYGGAIAYLGRDYSKLYVGNSKFVENTAYYGGAIALSVLHDIESNDTVNITNSIFHGNEATYGGAICTDYDNYKMDKGIEKSHADKDAKDRIPINFVSGYVTDCVFLKNTASDKGGAIYGAGLIVNYNIFEGNDAVLGSAIYDISILRSSKQIISNYDYNFWGVANNVTKLPKNLIINSEGSLTPANWVVVDIIEPVEGGNVFGVNFVLNDGSELTGVMPDYNALLTVNNMIKSISIVKNEYVDVVDSTGKYNVAVYCPLDGNLLASASFNVETLEMVVTTTVNGTTVTVTVKVAKDATGKVGFHLDNLLGIKYVDVVDGVAVCKYEKLAAGEHTVDVSYQGDDYVYKGSKATFTVSDMKISADDVDKFYKGPEQYIVTLIDGKPLAGETVSIYIAGKEYTRVTDDKGQAKMNINLAPGIYTVTAVYKGETVTNTIVVKSTVIGSDLTKIYRNDSQYTATFLDSNGKALANTEVWFNIVGVMYYRVTDANGVAKLNINLAPNDYIITAYNPSNGQLFSNMIHVLPQLVQIKTVDNLVALQVLDKKGQNVKAGEEVLLNFKGKILSTTSDSNGMVFFTDPAFDGTFATAYYDGCLVNVNLTSTNTNPVKEEKILW